MTMPKNSSLEIGIQKPQAMQNFEKTLSDLKNVLAKDAKDGLLVEAQYSKLQKNFDNLIEEFFNNYCAILADIPEQDLNLFIRTGNKSKKIRQESDFIDNCAIYMRQLLFSSETDNVKFNEIDSARWLMIAMQNYYQRHENTQQQLFFGFLYQNMIMNLSASKILYADKRENKLNVFAEPIGDCINQMEKDVCELFNGTDYKKLRTLVNEHEECFLPFNLLSKDVTIFQVNKLVINENECLVEPYEDSESKKHAKKVIESIYLLCDHLGLKSVEAAVNQLETYLKLNDEQIIAHLANVIPDLAKQEEKEKVIKKCFNRIKEIKEIDNYESYVNNLDLEVLSQKHRQFFSGLYQNAGKLTKLVAQHKELDYEQYTNFFLKHNENLADELISNFEKEFKAKLKQVLEEKFIENKEQVKSKGESIIVMGIFSSLPTKFPPELKLHGILNEKLSDITSKILSNNLEFTKESAIELADSITNKLLGEREELGKFLILDREKTQFTGYKLNNNAEVLKNAEKFKKLTEDFTVLKGLEREITKADKAEAMAKIVKLASKSDWEIIKQIDVKEKNKPLTQNLEINYYLNVLIQSRHQKTAKMEPGRYWNLLQLVAEQETMQPNFPKEGKYSEKVEECYRLFALHLKKDGEYGNALATLKRMAEINVDAQQEEQIINNLQNLSMCNEALGTFADDEELYGKMKSLLEDLEKELQISIDKIENSTEELSTQQVEMNNGDYAQTAGTSTLNHERTNKKRRSFSESIKASIDAAKNFTEEFATSQAEMSKNYYARTADYISNVKLFRDIKFNLKDKESLYNEIIPKTSKHGALTLGNQLPVSTYKEKFGSAFRISLLADFESYDKTETGADVQRIKMFDHGNFSADNTKTNNGKLISLKQLHQNFEEINAKTEHERDIYIHCMAGKSRSYFTTVLYLHQNHEKLFDWLADQAISDEVYENCLENATTLLKKQAKKDKQRLSENEITAQAITQVDRLFENLKNHPSVEDVGEFVHLRRPNTKPLEKMGYSQGYLIGISALNDLANYQTNDDARIRKLKACRFLMEAPTYHGFYEGDNNLANGNLYDFPQILSQLETLSNNDQKNVLDSILEASNIVKTIDGEKRYDTEFFKYNSVRLMHLVTLYDRLGKPSQYFDLTGKSFDFGKEINERLLALLKDHKKLSKIPVAEIFTYLETESGKSLLKQLSLAKQKKFFDHLQKRLDDPKQNYDKIDQVKFTERLKTFRSTFFKEAIDHTQELKSIQTIKEDASLMAFLQHNFPFSQVKFEGELSEAKLEEVLSQYLANYGIAAPENKKDILNIVKARILCQQDSGVKDLGAFKELVASYQKYEVSQASQSSIEAFDDAYSKGPSEYKNFIQKHTVQWGDDQYHRVFTDSKTKQLVFCATRKSHMKSLIPFALKEYKYGETIVYNNFEASERAYAEVEALKKGVICKFSDKNGNRKTTALSEAMRQAMIDAKKIAEANKNNKLYVVNNGLWVKHLIIDNLSQSGKNKGKIKFINENIKTLFGKILDNDGKKIKALKELLQLYVNNEILPADIQEVENIKNEQFQRNLMQLVVKTILKTANSKLMINDLKETINLTEFNEHQRSALLEVFADKRQENEYNMSIEKEDPQDDEQISCVRP